jgi:hypothetical protein
VGRLRHARTYDRDERGIACGARAPWRRSARSSRGKQRPIKEGGKAVHRAKGHRWLDIEAP